MQPTPLHRKKSPTSFPATPFKSWGSASQALPFWKFGWRFNPLPPLTPAEKGRCTLWPMCFVAMFYSIGRNICSLKLYLFIKLFSTLTFSVLIFYVFKLIYLFNFDSDSFYSSQFLLLYNFLSVFSVYLQFALTSDSLKV